MTKKTSQKTSQKTSLRFGPEIKALPGPSVLPLEVLRAMHKPSPDIYGGEIADISHSLIPDLKTIAGTAGEVAIYVANGHGAWEAALKNILCAGDKVLVLKTGMFAARWGMIAESLGIEIETIDFGMQGDVNIEKIANHLKQDKDKKIKAILTVQSDTASSIKNDICALGEMLQTIQHPALFCVDCIASLACDRFFMDEWNCDIVIAASQKGLMTPVGLSFVFFNERAKQCRKTATPGYYWDWIPRSNPGDFYQYFAGTAPTHHIYGLRAALDIILHGEGLQNVWARHEIIARAVWAAIQQWGSENKAFHHNISNESKRTVAVSAIATGDGDGARIRQWCEVEAGVVLGVGLGFGDYETPEYNSHFRIGHMGHNNIHMIMGTLGAIDAAMKALDIQHGQGALDCAARVLAQ